MAFRKYSSYKLTHYSGQTEQINAETMEQALHYMEIPEDESPVVSAVRTMKDINTLVSDDPKELFLEVKVQDGTQDGDSGCIATPQSGNIHVGDTLVLEAIPARNYEFVEWLLDGKSLSKEAKFSYVFEALDGDAELALVTAVFRLKAVQWTTQALPAEATTAGCMGFPTNGTTEANATQQFLGVAEGDWEFDHWERNGVSLGENKLLETQVEPLAEDEDGAVYTAVFKAK